MPIDSFDYGKKAQSILGPSSGEAERGITLGRLSVGLHERENEHMTTSNIGFSCSVF